jgi:hypothetical protein
MIKRLAANARRQDWFAVIVELIVVVLGIFVGLQVTDWNENRKAARLSDEYRASLAADLTADQVTAEKRTAYFEVAQGYGMEALAYLDSPNPQVSAEEAAALVTAFMLASTVWDYRQPRSTFEDLKATGNLALLGEMGLRIDLAAYYVTTDQKTAQWDLTPEYRHHVRSLIPAEAQRRIMGTCETLLGTGFSELVLRPDCRVDLSPWDTRAILAEIAASPGMHEDLTFWMSQLRLKIELYRDQISVARKMRVRVEEARRTRT